VQVQSKVGLKYDAWHKEIVSKFGNMLGMEMVDFHGQVSKVCEHTIHLHIKIGSGVAHVTRTLLSRSRSPGCFTHRGLNTSGSCSGERGNILGVGNYCYVVVCSAALGASAPTGGGEGRSIL